MGITELSKTKKNKKHKKIVCFDTEIVTKDAAAKLLLQSEKQEKTKRKRKKNHKEVEQMPQIKNEKSPMDSKEENEIVVSDNRHDNNKLSTISKKRKKSSKISKLEEVNKTHDISDENVAHKKNKKKTKPSQDQEKVNIKETPGNSEPDKEESIRAQKRKKHAKLLEEKKIKSELAAKQITLNYLSKWKYSRDFWKFEKLKQIWLQQNLFNRDNIPDEFWQITLEYFEGSKGVTRNNVLGSALKIIDKESNPDHENYHLVLQRARDIVQSLQE